MSLQSKLKFVTWTDITAYDQGYKNYLVNAHELRIKNEVADLYSKFKEKNKNQSGTDGSCGRGGEKGVGYGGSFPGEGG